MLTSLVLIFVACCIYAYWTLGSKRKGLQPPPFPGAWPIIGNLMLLLEDNFCLWRLLNRFCKEGLKCKGVISVSALTWKCYSIMDPEDALTVANSCFEKDRVYRFISSWLGEGLVTASVPTWRRHRKLLQPAFNQHILDGFLGVFNSSSRSLVNELSAHVANGYFDHTDYLKRTALEIICLTAMGVNDDNDKKSVLNNKQYLDAVGEMCKVVIDRATTIWMHNDFLYSLSSLYRKQEELLKILHDMSNTVIQRRKASFDIHRETENLIEGTFKSFLDLLLELQIQGVLTDQDIREEVDTMIVAGYDTTAHTMLYTLVILGSHTEVQEKVFEELKEVFGDSDRDVEREELSKLMYLEAVLKETLRIYPTLPMIVRYIDKEVQLKNYTLSPGRTCFLHLHGISRHPSWGPDADQFKPERWLDPVALPVNINSLFAGFGLGRRSCIGQRFALMSMKTVLSHVLRRYKISSNLMQMKVSLELLLTPISGHHITVEKRTT